MSFEAWLNKLRKAEKSSALQHKLRKVHYAFPDGTEMSEEYSTDTGVVLRRTWKRKRELLGNDKWEIELGERPHSINTEFNVRESSTEPALTKRITRKCIEWRIRNLPYPIETYSVSAMPDERGIRVSTKNKKYYKEIIVEELQRCNSPTIQSNITFTHSFNTLIITYQKPPIVNEMERAVLLILKDVETEDIEEGGDDYKQLLQSLVKP